MTAPGLIEKPQSSTSLPKLPHDPESLLRAGRKLLDKKQVWDARKVFERAQLEDPLDPRPRSYIGLCVATLNRKSDEGLNMCLSAAESKAHRVELLCNLGRAYVLVDDRKKAHDTLMQAQRLEANSEKVVCELKRLGQRRAPVLPFLPRSHAVNIKLGRLLGTLGLR